MSWVVPGRGKGLTLAAMLCAVTMVAASCSSGSNTSGASGGGGSTSSGSSTTSGSGGSGGSSTSGVAYATAQLKKFSQPWTAKPTGGPAITGTAALKGKTVWYVPILQTVPFFAEAATGMKDALTHLGMSFHECNAQATPSGATSCINQAVSSGASAIVTNAFPAGFAGTAITNAKSHNIPVVLGGDGFTKGNDQLAYVTLGYPAAQRLGSDWVIANSKGHANVLYVEITDSTVSQGYAETGALPEFQQHCSGCTVTVVKTQTVNLSSLPSLVSSNLVDHPNIDYVYPEFDVDVTAAIGGINSTNHKASLQVASVEGLLSAMQRVKSGNLQKVDVVTNGNESGWAMVDQVLRMLKGLPTVDNYHIGMRVITSANIGSLSLTATAQNAGTWVGPTSTYTSYFESLWK